MSYATPDRTEVLKHVRLLPRFGVDCFQDVLKLQPGDRWAHELYRHIDVCDVFLLFWSSAARKSRWVMKEARYALDRKNGDDDAPPDIHPIIIEKPAPRPPRHLQHLHFNDQTTYFMEWKRPTASRRRPST